MSEVVEVETDTAAGVIDALSAALEREAPFALLVRMPALAPDQRQRPDLKRLMWLKRNKPSIAARCKGMAYVLPSAEMRAAAPPPRRAAKVFGCPVEVFDGDEPARVWAAAKLEAT